MTDKFEQYKTMTADLRKLEVAVENFRKNRSALAKALLEENGKEHIYDLDGIPMIIATSKNGSCFLTPKHKGGRGKKAAIEASETAPAGISQDTPKAKRGRKPKVKKAIVNGQLIEVQAELKPLAEMKAEMKEKLMEAAEDLYGIKGEPLAAAPEPKEEIQLQKTIEGEASLLGGNPLAVEARQQAIAPTPAKDEGVAQEAKEEAQKAPLDPLEAALAEIDKAN